MAPDRATMDASLLPAVAPSPLQALLSSPDLLTTTHPASELTLAFQIQHNLQYQHEWSALRLHTHSPLTNAPLPRPLLTGLPPQRLYIHPEEQIELLKEAHRRKKVTVKAGAHVAETDGTLLDVKPEPEREWILPTRLTEKWTLNRLSEVFDAIGLVPPETEGQTKGKSAQANNPWRSTKRLVLATVDSDSTVVYYIIHDGVVKPRQN